MGGLARYGGRRKYSERMITELRCILVYFTHDVFYVGFVDRTDQMSGVLQACGAKFFRRRGGSGCRSKYRTCMLSWHSLTLFSLAVMHSTTLGLYSRSPAI